MAFIGSGAEPFVLPETQGFWDAVEQERLAIQQCADCGYFYFPPAPVCQRCTSRAVAWVELSGRASLYSFVIAQKPWDEWQAEGPMSVAHVELAEGPRLIATVVDCPQTPEALRIDMPLLATFRPFAGRKMLCFKPDEAAAEAQ